MRTKVLFRIVLISLGIALLTAALFFDSGIAVNHVPQTAATPTVDRLAEPTLPAAPSQADRGAQVYWLSCLPCHGDRGQGLTDEFRQVYPPEDQNCWTAGCHGKRPYVNGFTLPTAIPGLIGPGLLQNFQTAANLQVFIKQAMPFWKPGSLSDQESWEVTAFLLRQNGLWDARTELNASNADQIKVGGAAAGSPSQPIPFLHLASVILAAIVLLLALFLLFRFISRKPSS